MAPTQCVGRTHTVSLCVRALLPTNHYKPGTYDSTRPPPLPTPPLALGPQDNQPHGMGRCREEARCTRCNEQAGRHQCTSCVQGRTDAHHETSHGDAVGKECQGPVARPRSLLACLEAAHYQGSLARNAHHRITRQAAARRGPAAGQWLRGRGRGVLLKTGLATLTTHSHASVLCSAKDYKERVWLTCNHPACC